MKAGSYLRVAVVLAGTVLCTHAFSLRLQFLFSKFQEETSLEIGGLPGRRHSQRGLVLPVAQCGFAGPYKSPEFALALC